jgi:hypothetical protein
VEPKIIVTDEELRTQVIAAGGPAALCDPNGQTIGIVLSTGDYKQMRHDAGHVEFTPEYLATIDRCVAEGRVKKSAEVLGFLARLDKVLAMPC